MSFFDNDKTVGLALIIVGLINLIIAVVTVVQAGFDSSQDFIPFGLGYIIGAIATLIVGIVILGFGLKVRGTAIDDKVSFLSGLVKAVAVATILGAIFVAISEFLIKDYSFGAGIVAFIVAIIVGLFLLWVASKIGGKSQNIISKFLWIILLIVFIILVIRALISFVLGIFDADGLTDWLLVISQLCWILIYAFALGAVLSPEVKKSMDW